MRRCACQQCEVALDALRLRGIRLFCVPCLSFGVNQSTQEECRLEDINDNTETPAARITREMKTTVEAIAYIAEHMKAEMSDKKIRDDWKYVAMVIDRLLLLLFFGVTLGGTLGIICSAPHVFDFVDQEKIIKQLNAKYMSPTDEELTVPATF
ncbi:hypothetical protein OESDEN_01738 [Oesophagostomum dentatum]|uniref:Neurotransmitter-gated ion-channel transmembrane domain-containing protein n=1 Tax=Oesophagostomum dentatum TaxID=61180 RepID=A0A0B1TR26_OESDE|nr:hypothetical protein OESDEN_01738 [Oesophagostomum dentatum]